MSYNIDNVEVLESSLRISEKNAKKAAKLELPEGMEPGHFHFVDGYHEFKSEFWWTGEGSGNAYSDGTFKRFVALTEGEADLILTWEGGDSHSGVRIRDGKFKECEVVMTLANEDE